MVIYGDYALYSVNMSKKEVKKGGEKWVKNGQKMGQNLTWFFGWSAWSAYKLTSKIRGPTVKNDHFCHFCHFDFWVLVRDV